MRLGRLEEPITVNCICPGEFIALREVESLKTDEADQL